MKSALDRFLPELLGQSSISAAAALTGCAVAAVLGAVHALSPGHGKAVAAAYLIGARAHVRHALMLGAAVTASHTASVFALGIGVFFFFKTADAQRLVPVLGAVSGLSIVALGLWLLVRRWRALGHGHDHHHHHHHHHEEASTGTLLALGVSSGLVPCPSALVLLLTAISLGRPGLGLVLLVAFSFGLAAVLIGIGIAVLRAGEALHVHEHTHRFRWVPVASAGVVVVLGLVMTAQALGWLGLGG